ncbi:hypothetical protein EKK58_12685 [Candidatus Dependentiae bacterium]|nr:MAG: hypothetical protein EKK58_12685 [Candidatus Dependentiae bacterium]
MLKNIILLFFIATINVAMFGMEEKANIKKPTIYPFNNQNDIKNSFLFKIGIDENKIFIIFTQYSNPDTATVTILDLSTNNPATSYHIENVPKEIQHITKHATYCDLDSNGNYIFYVANQYNTVYKVVLTDNKVVLTDNKSLTATKLYTHNKAITHISLVKIKDTDLSFLVSGSLYPSIKIYNLQKNEIDNTQIHNRFFLGCIEDNIIYAKKNNRPVTGLGRFIDYWRSDKFECTLYYTNILNKPKEKEYKMGDLINSTIMINPNMMATDYYLIKENNNRLDILNEQSIISISINENIPTLNNTVTQDATIYTFNDPTIELIEEDPNKEYTNKELKDKAGCQKKLLDLFNKPEFYYYIEQLKNKKESSQSAQKTEKKSKKVKQNTLTYVKQNTLTYPANIIHQVLTEVIFTTDNNMLNLNAQLIGEKIKNEDFNPISLQKNDNNLICSPNYEAAVKNITFNTIWIDANENQKGFKRINNIYKDENSLIVQENNTLFHRIEDNTFKQIRILFGYKENILHFFKDTSSNSMFVITNKRLIQEPIDIKGG